MAAASNEQLFEMFMDLLDPLGTEVDVVLETSHNRESRGHVDLYREHIDLPVLKSILCDFEDLLLNDGCTGIAVLNPGDAAGSAVRRAQAADRLRREPAPSSRTSCGDRGVRCDDQMKFITEAEHVHSSSDQFMRAVRRAEDAAGHGLDVQLEGPVAVAASGTVAVSGTFGCWAAFHWIACRQAKVPDTLLPRRCGLLLRDIGRLLPAAPLAKPRRILAQFFERFFQTHEFLAEPPVLGPACHAARDQQAAAEDAQPPQATHAQRVLQGVGQGHDQHGQAR